MMDFWSHTTLASRGYFFFLSILIVRGEATTARREAGAFSNREHGLFNLMHFENGTLEPG